MVALAPPHFHRGLSLVIEVLRRLPKALVGLIDRPQKLVEVRRFLDWPNPVERRPQHLNFAARQEPDGDDPVRHWHCSTFVHPGETFGELARAYSFALASVACLRNGANNHARMRISAVVTAIPHWQQLAVYAVAAALFLLLLQRIPVIGRLVRFAISAGLLAFFLYVLLQQAPYQPQLARLVSGLGLDDQQISGKELRVKMAGDGHFWVMASINGVQRRMLIDSGATVTALSQQTARAAAIDTGSTFAPVILRTANGATPAQTGSVRELRVGNIVARNLKVVTAQGLGDLDVLGMNFLSKLESWRVEGGTLILVPHHPQPARRG